MVNGRKRWITNSVVAGWVSVLVRAARSPTDATMLLVDLSSPGVRIGEPDLKMGHRGQITADIVFDDVVVPAANLLGEAGSGLGVALSGRWCAGASGSARPVSAWPRPRSTSPSSGCGPAQVFGGPLGAMQHWQFTMARARDRDRVRAHALPEGGDPARPRRPHRRARGRDGQGVRHPPGQRHRARSHPDPRRGSASPVRSSESGESVRLEEMYRDAKILEIFEGANELQQWIVARQLIGRDVTG